MSTLDINKDFRKAAADGNLEQVKKIIIRDREFRKVVSDENMQVVKEIMKGNTYLDVNQQGPQSGNTALHFATLHGRIDVVRFLSNEPNVDKRIKNNDGDTPLHIAANKYDKQLLLDIITKDGSLRLEIEHTTQTLYNENVDMTIKNNAGLQPLQIYVKHYLDKTATQKDMHSNMIHKAGHGHALRIVGGLISKNLRDNGSLKEGQKLVIAIDGSLHIFNNNTDALAFRNTDCIKHNRTPF